MPVDLDHDLLRQLQIGRAIADGRREGDTSVVRDVTGFDHGKIDLAEDSLEKLLRAVREMDVREFDFPLVDRIPARFLKLESIRKLTASACTRSTSTAGPASAPLRIRTRNGSPRS
jgi:hypothetical protein